MKFALFHYSNVILFGAHLERSLVICRRVGDKFAAGVGFLLIIFWMGFWQGSPGDPVVYTLKPLSRTIHRWLHLPHLLNTVGFATTAVFVALFFAVPTAWLVERTDLPGKNLKSMHW